MSCGAVKNLEFCKGKTFSMALRWETAPWIYKPIAAIARTAPVSITVPAHGVPDGWRVAVVSVQGMDEVNAPNSPPKAKDFHQATVVDADTIQINDVNAAGFSAYTSGGYLQFYTPKDLTGYAARMSVKDRVGGTELLTLTTSNGRIEVDATNYAITLNVSATDTAGLTFSTGVYDLEMVASDGTVTALLRGDVVVTDEVTTA